MSRNHRDWLAAYIKYAGFSEAPKRMHFWSGVAAIAGALRRRVWIDQDYFKWHANHYIVLVAPPGIVSKSTTVAIAVDILRQVPGVGFGPDVVTWPALVTAFASATESFFVGDEQHIQSALTLESSEFGNLVNPQDREMIDLLITLWDSKQGSFKKVTKTSGNDEVENPWINMIACTTPSWIAGNFPEYVIGGGFTSRCLFVYAETKEKLVPYPHLDVPKDLKRQQTLLVEDLAHIASTLVGSYEMTGDAIKWGREWYKNWNANQPKNLQDDRFGGYLARKQTHIHKLAMVIAAANRDELVINDTDLAVADKMITDLEADMPKVFSRIGRTEDSIQAERLSAYVQRNGPIHNMKLYRLFYNSWPQLKDFEQVVQGQQRAGLIRIDPATGIVEQTGARIGEV
jgi:hypothetical protein